MRVATFAAARGRGRSIGAGLDRRAALALMTAGLAAARFARSGSALAAEPTPAPLLATPAQVDAERRLLELLADPELKRIQARLKAELAATPRAATLDGAATLDNAIAQWTNSLLFAELTSYRPSCAILWGTDDTPRVWLGHTLGGVGTSGDNPDAIYRTALIQGDGRYELLGRFPSNRAAQLVIEVDRGDLARPAEMMVQNPTHPDLGLQVALLTDKDLAIAPDGSFRLTLGPGAGGLHHVSTEPGPVTLGFRDMLSDWSQRPCQLTLRRLDGAPPQPFDPAELRRRVLADLPDYVRFWARFPDHWMGGLKPNSYAAPAVRAGGWGAVSGLRYTLEPDQALVVTTVQGAARYTGLQVIDPWMIAPDGRRHQASLNLSQAKPSPDGSFTYVISPTDPGVANWLDTAGLRDGFGIVRWQALPPGATAEGLLREFRVARLSEVENMALPRVAPEVRREQLAARARSYASRAL